MMLWIIAFVLFAAWIIGLLMGKGGFIHIFILNAIAVAIVKYAAIRRASRR
jgi:hypothetical protein